MVKDRDESEHRTSWGPRLLAPLAFFAAVTVLALLVSSSLNAPEKTEAATTTGSFATTADEHGDDDGRHSQEAQELRHQARATRSRRSRCASTRPSTT